MKNRITNRTWWKYIMKTALVGFFFGFGMNEAISLSMITVFACTISAIEKNKKEWQILIYLQEFTQRN